MVLNTLTVGANVAPTVIKTYTSHYLNRKSRKEKPTAHISYDEGLNLVRQFLHYASFHTVEEVQAFTAQWVPTPRWIRDEQVVVPERFISQAAEAIISQLGPRDVDRIGGRTWWQWRRDGSSLKADWIEMRGDYNERKTTGEQCRRVMLYVHGGAYFFGSVDEHRYQMQRHARKLKARVLAPRYRLSPQFPFPCGVLDCLAAYLYLLTIQDPSTIVLAGDSAGGGMVLTLLVILRDRGLPLPTGAVLISPWVDLTHSFPSVAGETEFDYIPAHGFMQRPSAAWPPPNSDDMQAIKMHQVNSLVNGNVSRKSTAVQGFAVNHALGNLNPEANKYNPAGHEGGEVRPGNTIPGPGHNLSIMLDGAMVEIKDQIQMYTTNQLISHPLVSPALQPSLGGLPPLLILVGGGEMLRDEQIYIAHKAANPSKYPPREAYLEQNPEARDAIKRWKPTNVQLQVWDDLCHVAPTLSFTHPAKYMYRSIAQFGAWALARAQRRDIDIPDDNASVISTSDSDNNSEYLTTQSNTKTATRAPDGIYPGGVAVATQIGKAGESLPPFQTHMIRQRVDRHGRIFPLAEPHELPALQMHPNEIGIIKPGPVQKWMAAKKHWDSRFAKEKRKVQKQRIKEMAKGFQGFDGNEVPPPSALAGRRGVSLPKEKKAKKSWGLGLWSSWGNAHDQKVLEREEKLDEGLEDGDHVSAQGKERHSSQAKRRSRSRSHVVSHLTHSDTVQTGDGIKANNEGIKQRPYAMAVVSSHLSPNVVPLPHPHSVFEKEEQLVLVDKTLGGISDEQAELHPSRMHPGPEPTYVSQATDAVASAAVGAAAVLTSVKDSMLSMLGGSAENETTGEHHWVTTETPSANEQAFSDKMLGCSTEDKTTAEHHWVTTETPSANEQNFSDKMLGLETSHNQGWQAGQRSEISEAGDIGRKTWVQTATPAAEEVKFSEKMLGAEGVHDEHDDDGTVTLKAEAGRQKLLSMAAANGVSRTERPGVERFETAREGL